MEVNAIIAWKAERRDWKDQPGTDHQKKFSVGEDKVMQTEETI